MGMYDELWISCPKCGRMVDFQSKGGECSLNQYTVFDVPSDVAGHINGESQWCECGAELTLQVQCSVNVHVTNNRGT